MEGNNFKQRMHEGLEKINTSDSDFSDNNFGSFSAQIVVTTWIVAITKLIQKGVDSGDLATTLNTLKQWTASLIDSLGSAMSKDRETVNQNIMV